MTDDRAHSIGEVLELLKGILIRDMGMTPPPVGTEESVPLTEEGWGLDSVTLVSFINCIEERLEFTFAEDDLRARSFESLKTLADVIAARVAN